MTLFVFSLKAAFDGVLHLCDKHKRDMASQVIGNSNVLICSLNVQAQCAINAESVSMSWRFNGSIEHWVFDIRFDYDDEGFGSMMRVINTMLQSNTFYSIANMYPYVAEVALHLNKVCWRWINVMSYICMIVMLFQITCNSTVCSMAISIQQEI